MFKDNLNVLKEEGLLRTLLTRSSCQGPVITIKRRKYINFSSNDYLGLAAHPDLEAAAVKAMHKYGFGAGSSRLLAGGSDLHAKLETDVASWKKTGAALIFNSGYAANTGVLPAIASDGDIIFSDELNHASIIDGCRLSRARTVIYRHNDMSHLEKLLKLHKGKRNIIATDTVFSMEGDIAPLYDIYRLCLSTNKSARAHDSLILYLDEAHATGVLGQGKGALAHFGIKPEPWIIQMGTFSKAFGSFGAYVAGSKDIIEWITNRARSLIYSTALPNPAAAASIAALKIIKKDHNLLSNLWKNRALLEKSLSEIGYNVTGSTPIMPIMVPSSQEAVMMAAFLFEKGLYVPAIRPPAVRQPRLRIVVTAAHEKGHIEKLKAALNKWKKGESA